MSNSALMSEDDGELHETVIERKPRKFHLTLDPVTRDGEKVKPESLKQLRERLSSQIEVKKVIDKPINLVISPLMNPICINER